MSSAHRTDSDRTRHDSRPARRISTETKSAFKTRGLAKAGSREPYDDDRD